MTKDYTHVLNEEVASISGRYEIVKEERVEYRNREFLYIIGNGVVDSSCCGTGTCHYAVVPGFMVHWKSRASATGFLISEVETISDETARLEIRKIIEEREQVNQVQFW